MALTKLRKIDKFAASQNPYWFDLSSIQHGNLGGANIDAIWFGRKKGLTTVTFGTYSLYFPKSEKNAPVSHLIEIADTRYGGSWMYQWDGESFLREPMSPLSTPADLAEVQTRLDNLLADTPDPFPVGSTWDGPYYKAKVDLP